MKALRGGRQGGAVKKPWQCLAWAIPLSLLAAPGTLAAEAGASLDIALDWEQLSRNQVLVVGQEIRGGCAIGRVTVTSTLHSGPDGSTPSRSFLAERDQTVPCALRISSLVEETPQANPPPASGTGPCRSTLARGLTAEGQVWESRAETRVDWCGNSGTMSALAILCYANPNQGFVVDECHNHGNQYPGQAPAWAIGEGHYHYALWWGGWYHSLYEEAGASGGWGKYCVHSLSGSIPGQWYAECS